MFDGFGVQGYNLYSHVQLRTTNRKQLHLSSKTSWLKPEGIAPNRFSLHTRAMVWYIFTYIWLMFHDFDFIGSSGYAGISRYPPITTFSSLPPAIIVTGPPGSWQLDLRFFFIRIQAGSQPANKLVQTMVESPNVSGTENGGILTYISCMDTAYVRENPAPKWPHKDLEGSVPPVYLRLLVIEPPSWKTNVCIGSVLYFVMWSLQTSLIFYQKSRVIWIPGAYFFTYIWIYIHSIHINCKYLPKIIDKGQNNHLPKSLGKKNQLKLPSVFHNCSMFNVHRLNIRAW